MSDDRQRHRGAEGDNGASAEEGALSTVETLMAERRKYESWLETLEARRQSTPERVFTRVHGDYHDRLDAVIQQLKEHTEGLRAELASLTSRLSSIDNEQQQRRDERAEAELRAHVGELSPDAWRDIANESDKAIDALTARHGELERERLRTRELLNEAERPPTPRDAVAAVPAPKQPPVAPPRAAEPQAPVRAAESASVRESAQPVVEQPPVEVPPPVIAAEARLIEQASAASGADRADADVTPPPMPRADASRAPGGKSDKFDELAFLSSVVNTPAGTADVSAPSERPDESTRRDAFAQRASESDIMNPASEPNSVLGGAAARAASSPLAMNVSGNNPIIIRDKMTETAKTLKCAECGAMNYPTEWYCERCGAELASL
jgi:hypothetical protein